MKPRLKRYPGLWFEWQCSSPGCLSVGHTAEEAYNGWLYTVQGRERA